MPAEGPPAARGGAGGAPPGEEDHGGEGAGGDGQRPRKAVTGLPWCVPSCSLDEAHKVG